jgi:hypothetical protein
MSAGLKRWAIPGFNSRPNITWAVKLGSLGMFAVLEGILFILILIVGLVYTWRKGMLEWA